MLAFALLYRHSERITRVQALGSFVAFLGMAVVVLNGRFVLHLSPLGDMLAFAACLCWVVYSLLMKPFVERYSTLFITRKVFIYGLVTIIPYYLIVPGFPSLDVLLKPDVIWNLLFLGVVDVLGCTYDPNQVGMFLWGKIPEKYADVEDLTEKVLHEARVFITPGFIFGSNGQRYIRISLCAKEDKIKEALERIKNKIK